MKGDERRWKGRRPPVVRWCGERLGIAGLGGGEVRHRRVGWKWVGSDAVDLVCFLSCRCDPNAARGNQHGVEVVGKAPLEKLVGPQHPAIEFETEAFRRDLERASELGGAAPQLRLRWE